jgi:hypothetical protein
MSYNVVSFLDDLADIRDKVLVPLNIISAFVCSGIYLPNPAYILKQMERYNNRRKLKVNKTTKSRDEPLLLQFPLFGPTTLTKLKDSVYSLIY